MQQFQYSFFVEKRSIEEILGRLNEAQVHYLIVGGLAVVAHGFLRFTADLDLVLSIEDQNLRKAVLALKALDYRPRAPVPFEEFLNAEMRRQWSIEKGMRVFSLFSGMHPETEIDLFLESPLDFSSAYARALRLEIAPGVLATFACFDDLIDLKEMANRPVDLEDIRQLCALRGDIKP